MMLLETLWREMALHLWQTTVFLAVLGLLACLLRSAPARYQQAIGWIALAKLFLPLALFRPFFSIADRGSSPLVEYVSVTLRPNILADTPLGLSTGSSIWLVLISLAWVLGVALLTIRWIHRDRSIDVFFLTSLDHASESVRVKVHDAIVGSGIPSRSIVVGDGPVVPAVSGLLHPRILLPLRIVGALEPVELRSILLHEDRHRRRRDPLLASLQRVALAIFFFYPPTWWIVRRLRDSAEIVCDAAVLAAGVPAETYSRALARALSLDLLPATVGLGRISGLRRRLNRIDRPWRYTVMPKHRMAIAAAVIALVLSCLPFAAPAAGLGARAIDDLERLEDHDLPILLHFEHARLDLILDSMAKTVGWTLHYRLDGTPGCSIEIDTTASAALRQLGLQCGVRFEVLDSTTLVALPAHVAGMNGVMNPVLVSRVDPIYPDDGREARVGGAVIVEALIRADGSVGNTKVLRGVTDYPSFAEAALEAIAQWHYEPATQDGVPVDVLFTIFVEFSLQENWDSH